MTSRPVLRPGSVSEAVESLQSDLQSLGYVSNMISKGVEKDGVFGTATERALRAFQARANLAPDGICGPETWAALDRAEMDQHLPLAAPDWAFVTPEDYPVTSKQGWRKMGGVDQYHGGVDFGMPQGTPLYAPCNGSVVALDHNHTIAGGIIVVRDYATQWGFTVCHLSDIRVELGDVVSKRQLFGLSGGTPGTHGAGYSTGAHLHISVQRRGLSIDPSGILRLPVGARGILPPDRLT